MATWQELKDNPQLRGYIETRFKMLRLVREFFWSRDFLEAQTPLALRYPGQEPYLTPVPVTFHEPSGAAHQFYLHTSPEFSLKKLLAAGFSKIFEITKTFRDYEDWRGTHNPEFTMIEWYRAPGTYRDFMNDLEELFIFVSDKLGQPNLSYRGRQVPVRGGWERLSMKQVWQQYLQVNLDDYLEQSALAALASKKGYTVEPSDAYEDIFFKIFLNEVEPKLGLERPLFIYDYPAQMTSLSRPCASDPRYAERAELYAAGLELANGFGELTDAAAQERNLERDQTMRAKFGKQTWPVDPSFIAALHSGLPPAGGVAMGFDRMVLLFTGAKNINEAVFNSPYDQLSN